MHYVCTGGCQGVSSKPGSCQAPNCTDYQHDLKPCECQDGKHEKVMAEAKHVKGSEE